MKNKMVINCTNEQDHQPAAKIGRRQLSLAKVDPSPGTSKCFHLVLLKNVCKNRNRKKLIVLDYISSFKQTKTHSNINI